jgi:hypothetical protein
MIRFESTVHNTVHAYALGEAGDEKGLVRQIAAQARGKGATGSALRKEISADEHGSVLVHVAYRAVPRV